MLRRLRMGLLLACSCLPLWQLSAQAQDTQGTTAAEDRAQSFQAVTGGVREDVPGGPLTLGAYAVVWAALFGYVFRLTRLQRGVEANLSRLEQTVTSDRATIQPAARQGTGS